MLIQSEISLAFDSSNSSPAQSGVETKYRKEAFLLQPEQTYPRNVDWYSELSSQIGPDSLVRAKIEDPVLVDQIVAVCILSGTRKAAFVSAFFRENVRTVDGVLPVTQINPVWSEDLHKDKYQMSGVPSVLKVGVSVDKLLAEGAASVSSDVSVKVDGKQLHRYLSAPLSEIRESLVDTLTRERTIGVKSQIAGLVRNNNGLQGVVINPSMTYTTSRLSPEEIDLYLASLDEAKVRRSPGAILWPHPIIEPHITTIDGIDRLDARFHGKYLDLLQHLLGVPVLLRLLIKQLDKRIGEPVENDENLYGLLNLNRIGLLGENEKLDGNWQELVRDNRGEWLILRNAKPADYKQMSDIAIRNFKEAPNYAYLQSADGRSQQEKYIAANTPEGIQDLCSKANNICNLVIEKEGKILGFRVVRQNNDVADGRRMHTDLDETGRGIGRLLLSRSEKFAKQVGCKTMEVHATGESYAWFERSGFKNQGIRPNTISDYYLMIKEL